MLAEDHLRDAPSVIPDRLDALVVARAYATGAQSLGEMLAPLARFAPPELTAAAWVDQLAEVVAALRTAGVLDEQHQLRSRGELARRIGKTTAKTWPQLADSVLPALALGIAADEAKLRAKLDGKNAWAAAIAGRAIGLWTAGPPLSLPALCDALVWRELGLPGTPKRCPPELRALFVQRQLRTEPGPPDRLVRLLAAREVGAQRPELRALRDALVCGWLAGRQLGQPVSERRTADAETFVADVLRAADAIVDVRDGRIGDRKLFIAAIWRELRRQPRWAELSLDELKARLYAAHRAGELVLARADYVAAMDPELVRASEIAAGNATFHFVVKEPAA